ncbi:MAG: hypothetical protein H0W62_04125 [Chitinophagales bacterium]|nr:hypothetical protein [Chitinophagales bacterium]
MSYKVLLIHNRLLPVKWLWIKGNRLIIGTILYICIQLIPFQLFTTSSMKETANFIDGDFYLQVYSNSSCGIFSLHVRGIISYKNNNRCDGFIG